MNTVTELHNAVQKGQSRKIQRLVEEGVDLNAKFGKVNGKEKCFDTPYAGQIGLMESNNSHPEHHLNNSNPSIKIPKWQHSVSLKTMSELQKPVKKTI